LVTVTTTKEYSPEELSQFQDENESTDEETGGIITIFKDFKSMPDTMKQLSWVQFFSWFALFGMWVFFTPAIAQYVYELDPNDSSSAMYNEAGDWVGILFGVYNLVSAFFAFSLPAIAKKIGRKKTHSLSLIIGGIGFLSIYLVPNEYWLILSMVGVGIAWASILAMPYAILAGSIPPSKMGIYMGIFNFFIVIPQITYALFGGPMVKHIFNGHAIYAIIVSGISFFIAAFLVTRVKDVDEVIRG